MSVGTRWFYMSFADPELPEGTQFLGGAYVEAYTLEDAIAASHLLGINPGGEIQMAEIAQDYVKYFEQKVPEADRNRLLTREEIESH